MSDFVLEMRNIDKSFFNVKVLDGVSFDIKPGEVHALVGENGAGKSTLMKIMMGIYRRDAGEIFLESNEVVFHAPKEALDLGIAMIPQELSPILDIEVAEYKTQFECAPKQIICGLGDSFRKIGCYKFQLKDNGLVAEDIADLIEKNWERK